MNNKKITIIAVVVVLIVVGFLFLRDSKDGDTFQKPAEGMNTFVSPDKAFSFQYPESWKAYPEEMVFTSWKSDSPQISEIPEGESVIVIEVFTDLSSPEVQALLESPDKRGDDALPLWPDAETYPSVVADSVFYLEDQHDRSVAQKMGVDPADIGFENGTSIIGISVTDSSRLYHITGVGRGSAAEDNSVVHVFREIMETWDFTAETPYDRMNQTR